MSADFNVLFILKYIRSDCRLVDVLSFWRGRLGLNPESDKQPSTRYRCNLALWAFAQIATMGSADSLHLNRYLSILQN